MNNNNANIINKWNQVNLQSIFCNNGVEFYQLTDADFANDYYIVSSKDSRNLMNHPEIIGFDVYASLLKSTLHSLNFLNKNKLISYTSILNILRGGLNFPIEEACRNAEIDVFDIGFISSERVFDKHGNIDDLAIKYNKINAIPNSTLLIGDIFASGETLSECLKYAINLYRQKNTNLRNIILFTIGGTRAINILENLTKEIKVFWPNFEGFVTIFYEGIFSCYEPGDNGISGINRPLIDFIWGEGIISPSFRKQTLSIRGAIFEKCIIYDGGARRYNIKEHIDEVLEFWNGVLLRSNKIDMHLLLEEKLGHEIPISYENWLINCHYHKIDENVTKFLYQQECDFIESLKNTTLRQIAQKRIEEFSTALKKYN